MSKMNRGLILMASGIPGKGLLTPGFVQSHNGRYDNLINVINTRGSEWAILESSDGVARLTVLDSETQEIKYEIVGRDAQETQEIYLETRGAA
ncbi:MAG: hypothetical protein KKB21_02615 [Nanoarchaeota archaeon]|nr:hypothetical protein [Nanoarchaeota archaeon]MBU4086448.1 hypothetical protein [Nanoarchaeota archaeon]